MARFCLFHPLSEWKWKWKLRPGPVVNINLNVNSLLAISKSNLNHSGEPGPQAQGVNHLETPFSQTTASNSQGVLLC